MNAYGAILRLAACLVPPDLRDEWLAEWRGELAHTRWGRWKLLSACRGSFQDAYWLRRNTPSSPLLDSPAACLLLLAAGVAIARAATAAAGPARGSPAAGLPLVFVCASLLASVNAPLSIGPAGSRAWAFFLAKLGLIAAATVCSLGVCANLCAWGGLQVLIAACALAFRWSLADQRRRCPVCLRRLTKPVSMEREPYAFLGWNGVETMCSRGHGLLYVPEFPSDRFHAPNWVALDRSWSGLFRTPLP